MMVSGEEVSLLLNSWRTEGVFLKVTFAGEGVGLSFTGTLEPDGTGPVFEVRSLAGFFLVDLRKATDFTYEDPRAAGNELRERARATFVDIVEFLLPGGCRCVIAQLRP